MSDYVLTVTIPEDEAKKAEELGLLSSDNVVTLLRKQIAESEEARVVRLRAELTALFGESAEISEEEIEVIIHESREENFKRTRAIWDALDAIEPKWSEAEFEQILHEARRA